jgi:hypothetical protein
MNEAQMIDVQTTTSDDILYLLPYNDCEPIRYVVLTICCIVLFSIVHLLRHRELKQAVYMLANTINQVRIYSINCRYLFKYSGNKYINWWKSNKDTSNVLSITLVNMR